MVRLVAIAVLLSAAGCTRLMRWPSRASWRQTPTQFSKEELHELLTQFYDTFEASLRDAADRIQTAQPDRRTRRLLLLMQTRVLPMMRDAVDQDDALPGLLDSYVLAKRFRDFLVEGDGREMFGEKQHLVVEASQRALEQLEGIASRALDPEVLERAGPAVESLARRFPLRGEFSGTAVRTAVQKAEESPDALTAILTAPIAPFRAFEGIDRGAAAIQGFTAVASRMTDTVRDLPESARLQTQLLLLEMEDLETVRSAAAAIEQLARSSARIAAVAEHLPQDLRRELSLVAADLESRQAELQRTLVEAQQTAGRVSEALGRVESAASAVERTAVHTADAGDAWTHTFRAITDMVGSFRRPGAMSTGGDAPPAAASGGNGPASEPEPAVPRRFDINDYTVAAQALDQAAARLQDLTREIRGLAGSRELMASLGDVESRARGVVETSRSSAVDVVDRLAWRGAQLIGLALLAALVYRLSGRFLGPPRRTAA